LIFSALSSLLYHWRILPWVVNACAWALGKVFKIKGATSFACVATVFVGMVQAPLLVRPYLKSLGRSELFVIMNSGMATISGTVLIIYANMLQNVVANASTHLFIACIVNALSAVILSLIVIPHLPMERQAKQVHLEPQDNRLLVDIETQKYHSSMQAIAEGTQQGIKLLGNVLAMLIVLVALVSLTNALLECLPNVSEAPITLQRVAALVMQPLAWCLGVPWQDTPLAAELMGTKLVLNEFVAYVNLSHYPMDAMQDKTKILLTYILCGFANFGSLGILIAGLGAMLPERQKDIIDMGLRSLIVGTLSTCLTAAMASLILFTHL
jgi:CNT family concentrative nucleoside transporter